jgi:FKBP-type peptidyl-prolyl cis-trans isomerase
VLTAAAVVLTGCGSSNSSSSAGSGDKLGLDSIAVKGDFGTDPTITFSGQVTDPTPATKTLVVGKGPKLAKGDMVRIQTVIADGYTQKTVASSYKDKQSQVATLSDQVTPVIEKALEGSTVGSRVLVYAPASQVFGPQGNTTLGIDAQDQILIVIDTISKPKPALKGPQGKSQPAPGWAPKLVTKGKAVTSLDFAKTPKPDGKLRSAVLIRGKGETVKSGQSITVNYLGQVYDAKKPFDESYSKTPATFGIGNGQVISGWDKTLVGQKVGSRVILAIPPADGYGKAGQPSVGIQGTDTLYFVVDILGAA